MACLSGLLYLSDYMLSSWLYALQMSEDSSAPGLVYRVVCVPPWKSKQILFATL